MSWIDHVVERKIAEAIARDELAPAHLRGTPLDLDSPRTDGWWAEQFVRKERSRLLRDEATEHHAVLRAGLWRAPAIADLHDLMIAANRWVERTNATLAPGDALELFVPADVTATWRSLHSA